MATSVGLVAFQRRMQAVGADIQKAVDKVVRSATSRTFTRAIVGTPVDTGRARGNWVASFDFPSDEFDPSRFDKLGGATVTKADIVIAQYDSDRHDAIVLANSTRDPETQFPYVVGLDQGTSRQAPLGMTRLAVQAGAQFVRRSRILVEI